MYYFYLSLEKPAEKHTEHSFHIWRARNPDSRLYLHAKKLANIRRDIMRKDYLTLFEKAEYKKKARDGANKNDI